MTPWRRTIWQWFRFSLVGAKANVIYFCLYILITAAGFQPAIAVTFVFIVGAIYTFWLNKSFVFKDPDAVKHQLPRYLLIYFVAWALNVAALDFMVSRIGMNHIVAQGLLIGLFAVLLFVAQKTLVFRGAR
jgi:putative flippase GtrA